MFVCGRFPPYIVLYSELFYSHIVPIHATTVKNLKHLMLPDLLIYRLSSCYTATRMSRHICETECRTRTQCIQGFVNWRKREVSSQTHSNTCSLGALGCLGALCGALWCWGRTFNRWRQLPPRIVMFNYLCPIYTFVMGEKDRETGKWERELV